MNKSNFLNKMSIRWVVALKEEAKVILDYYKMKLLNKKLTIVSNGAQKRGNKDTFKKYNDKLQYWSIELDKV